MKTAFKKNICTNNLNTHIKILLIILVTLTIFSLSICLGSVKISILDECKCIVDIIFGTRFNNDNITYSIIKNIRIPRTCMSFLVGVSLSLSGCVMQSILKNPLASSYTLGVSSGASLGAAIVIISGATILGSSLYITPIVAFIFAFATVLFILFFTKCVDKNITSNTLILVGMVLSLFINGILSLISMLNQDYLQSIIFWQMGSFDSADMEKSTIIFIIVVISILLLLKYSFEMDIMSFGEEYASTSGINTKKARLILILIATLLSGVSVSFCGTIGFIDLIAPHITRKIFGSSHKKLLILSSLIGGSLMMLSDLISRTILAPRQIPVGCVTALIGAPFFAYVFFSNKNTV